MNRNVVNQFASRLIQFSSQYSDTNWKASNVLGPPVSNGIYGDNVGAWCPSTSDQNQFLEVGFETPVFVSSIKVYENYHGGAITKIEALNGDNYITLWSSLNANTMTQYNIFQPTFQITNFKSNQIRLTLTLSTRNLFSEIEAIELVGSLLEIGTPEKSIVADIASLFHSKLFADIDIVVGGSEFMSSTQTVQAHRNILASRSPLLFDLISKRNGILNDMKFEQLQLVLEFIYSDDLNETLLKKIIDDEKRTCEPLESETFTPISMNDENCEYPIVDWNPLNKRWLLVINDLVRIASIFKLKRLESLLVNYLANDFLSIDNVLFILIDSRQGNELEPVESLDESVKLNGKFQLKLIEDVCLDFSRINLKDISKHHCFPKLPRDVIIDIIRNLF